MSSEENNNKPTELFPTKDFAYINGRKYNKRVKRLNLSNKNLNIIDGELATFPLLELIDLSNNQLKQIPRQIFDCKNLKYLNLTHNQINFIDPKMEKQLIKWVKSALIKEYKY